MYSFRSTAFTGCNVGFRGFIGRFGVFFLFCLFWVPPILQQVCLILNFFSFFGFSVYVVIFCVDLGPGTFVMGDFGNFWGFGGFHRSRASFGGIEADYQKDLRAVVVPRTAEADELCGVLDLGKVNLC